MKPDTPSVNAPATPRLRWAELMPLYRDAHRRPGTRIAHMIGIPMIVAALPIAPWHPGVAVALFAAGWVCQLGSHAVFEKNKPRFASDWRNLLIGVAWSGIEWAQLLRRILGRSTLDDRRS